MKKKRFLPTSGAWISGLLIGTSYIPFPPWAIFFCFVPLWTEWLNGEQKPSRVFLSGWWTQFILTAIGFHWISYTTVEFGHLPWIVGILALLGFGLFAHLQFPLAGWIWALLNKKLKMSRTMSLLSIVFLTWSLENTYPMIFPWHLGYTWAWVNWPAIQWTDVFGFQGLSLLTLLFNAGFTAIFSFKDLQKSTKTAIAAMMLLLFVALNWTGHYRKLAVQAASSQGSNHSSATFRALVVQANIGNYEKYIAERVKDARRPIVDTYMRLLNEAVKKETTPPDITIWPETAFPDLFDAFALGSPYQQEVLQFLRAHNLVFLGGAYSADIGKDKPYNAIFLINPSGQLVSRYRKTILLAFGEYIPGGDLFPFLKTIIPEISDFGRGSGPTVMSYGDKNFGVLICYEGLFPEFAATIAKNGANIFVNVTNDSWFGRPFEPNQHRIMTLARALEFRRPMIRSTNTGITSVMLPDGTELEQSPIGQEWYHTYEIPYTVSPVHTLFESLAPQIPLIGWSAVLLIFILSWILKIKKVKVEKQND